MWKAVDLGVAFAVGVCLGLLVAAISKRPVPVTEPSKE